MGLREIFGRNININKDIRKRYDELLSGFIFRDRDMKNIFMLCLALGYHTGRKTPVNNPVGLLNTNSFDDADLWTIVSVAMEDKGDISVINNPAEMRRIATEYAHTGLDELELLVAEYGSGENLELAIEKKAKDVLAEIIKA